MNKKKGLGVHSRRSLFTASTINAALLTLLFACVLVSFLLACPPTHASNPAVWSLVWSDEFAGPTGSAVHSGKESFVIGGKRWGTKDMWAYCHQTRGAH